MPNRIEIEVPKWNEIRKKNHQNIIDLYEDKIILICPVCKFTVQDQPHKDVRSHPHKVQVVCQNPECNYVDYRLE